MSMCGGVLMSSGAGCGVGGRGRVREEVGGGGEIDVELSSSIAWCPPQLEFGQNFERKNAKIPS